MFPKCLIFLDYLFVLIVFSTQIMLPIKCGVMFENHASYVGMAKIQWCDKFILYEKCIMCRWISNDNRTYITVYDDDTKVDLLSAVVGILKDGDISREGDIIHFKDVYNLPPRDLFISFNFQLRGDYSTPTEN